MADAKTSRLSSEQRRAQIVEAALAVFGAKGYVGARTDDIARAASVSQPYVVRLFETKENLFVAAIQEALDRITVGFAAAVADTTSDVPLEHRIGHAYIELVQVRGLHQTLSQAFLLGAHPVIGPCARNAFARVWSILRDAGFDAAAAKDFLAEGMLINTLIGLRLADDYGNDPRVDELFDTCFPAEKMTVLAFAPRADEPW